jgi:flagellin
MIIRMRELAAQAASATVGPSERGLLQLEVNALVAEINRFSSATEFNGQKLLDGSFASLIVHFGLDATANSQLDIAVEAGIVSTAVDMAFILSGTSTPFAVGQSADFGGSVTGGTLLGLSGGPFLAEISIDGAAALPISIPAATTDFDALIIAINGQISGATASITPGGNITFKHDIPVSTSSISVTDTGATPLLDLFANLPGFVSLQTPFVGLDISTATAAQAAVTSLDTATDSVITVRAGVAATQNRMTRIINTQATTIENLTAAESQIRDADIAEEIALLTRNQILVESATAMVGQANLIPQSVLQLLG